MRRFRDSESIRLFGMIGRDAVREGICVRCRKPAQFDENDWKFAIEFRNYDLSGLCRKCVREMWPEVFSDDDLIIERQHQCGSSQENSSLLCTPKHNAVVRSQGTKIDSGEEETMAVPNETFSEVLSELVRNYKRNDMFEFYLGNCLKDNIKKGRVSANHGVYVIYAWWDEHNSTLIYIGKSGTISTDGSIGAQGLAGRLGNKQEGLQREKFFNKILSGEDSRINGKPTRLEIKWIETFKDNKGEPPFFAEARLLRAYLSDWMKLPPLNNEA